MDENKAKSIFNLTSELHDDVTILYEELMDDETNESSAQIDLIVGKLKHLKSNLINRDE